MTDSPTLYDALVTIADVWSLPAVPMPEGRKWHCQHEEALHSAVLVARAAIELAHDEHPESRVGLDPTRALANKER